MTTRFQGKVALVTGAGKGIGEAAAHGFAQEGAAVAVLDNDSKAAESVASEIVASGARAIAVTADVTSSADAARAVSETVTEFGGLDVLVNNAGVIRYGDAVEFPEDDWDLVVGVNLKGPFLMCKHAIPEMRKRGGGAVVNTTSVQAFVSQERVVAYTATKGGVLAMTRGLALDHAKDNIRVNCIAPGSVRTPMLEWAADIFVPEDPVGAMERWGEAHPIGRLIEPEECAKLILFLASDDASAITASCQVIDGGLIATVAVK